MSTMPDPMYVPESYRDKSSEVWFGWSFQDIDVYRTHESVTIDAGQNCAKSNESLVLLILAQKGES